MIMSLNFTAKLHKNVQNQTFVIKKSSCPLLRLYERIIPQSHKEHKKIFASLRLCVIFSLAKPRSRKKNLCELCVLVGNKKNQVARFCEQPDLKNMPPFLQIACCWRSISTALHYGSADL